MSGRAGDAQVVILGLGLMGTSLACALVRRGWRCAGWDPDGIARRRARRSQIRVPARRDGLLETADLIVLCAPPVANRELLAQLPDGPATVTDVGSVKREIAREGRALLGDRFVPGHPMAGSAESSGLAADPDLFRGRSWILCGGGETHRRRVTRMIRAVGAIPGELRPDAHDKAVAWTSHLPQVLASLLVAETGRSAVTGKVIGPGFEGWARLADSSPDLWREILDGNREAVLAALDRYRNALDSLCASWAEDPAAVQGLLRRGRSARSRLARDRGAR